MPKPRPHILERAEAAIAAFQAKHDDGKEAQLRDLLADLRHWAEIAKVDFEHESAMALQFWKDEISKAVEYTARFWDDHGRGPPNDVWTTTSMTDAHIRFVTQIDQSRDDDGGIGYARAELWKDGTMIDEYEREN